MNPPSGPFDIAITSRSVGILVGVARLGAILADVSHRQLLSAAKMEGKVDNHFSNSNLDKEGESTPMALINKWQKGFRNHPFRQSV
jgi:hypothetical protein